jgi:excisionase family DNA binding protein
VKLLTIKQAAEALGVHPNTLRRWADQGTIPVTKLPSGYRRWTPAQIEQIRQDVFVTEDITSPESEAA